MASEERNDSSWHFEVSCCRDAVIALRVLECVFILAASLIAIVYILVLYKNKVMHSNLRLILKNLVVIDLIILYVRFMDILDFSGLIVENRVELFVKIICWTFTVISLMNLEGERTYALYAYATYDDGSTATPWTMIGIYCMETILVLSIGVGFTAGFRASRFKLGHNSLNSRFQIIESLRSARFLKWLIPFKGLGLLTTAFLGAFIIFYVQKHHPEQQMIMQTLIYTFNAPRAIGSTLIPLFLHSTLRAEMLRIVRCAFVSRHQTHPVSVTEIGAHVMSDSGQQLSFTPAREREIYFKTYSAIWAQPLDQKTRTKWSTMSLPASFARRE